MRLVSVIIPTLRRPGLLRRAAASTLAQELPGGWDLELVIVLSDPSLAADRAAAEAVAEDPRVRVVEAARRGAGAARNRGIEAAGGEVLAFMDDDCRADPAWLRESLAALADADIVQGRTVPDGPVPMLHRSMWVTPPSWLWETCNLVVRHEAAARAGGFAEHWNAAGRVGHQGGEDVEWGWRVVRSGARPGFTPDAVMRHVVEPRGLAGHLAYKSRIRIFPRLFRTTPEARQVFYGGHFVNRRHAAISGALALLGAAALARRAGRRGTAVGLVGAATAVYLAPLPAELAAGAPQRLRRIGLRSLEEVVEYACAAYGSVRWRRLLL